MTTRGVTHPRDLVCEVCWQGFFDTQEYQDLFSPASTTSLDNAQPHKATQETSSQHVRDKSTFITRRQDIASSKRFPKTGCDISGLEPAIECNWCEYMAGHPCCELDEEGNAPDYEEDLLKISLETVRVDCSTPSSSPGAGGKVVDLSLDRCNRRTGKSLHGSGSMHHAYTPASDPAAEVIVSRPIRSDVGSQAAAEQIAVWIQNCESRGCGKNGGFFKDTLLPSRVIDIGLNGTQRPRVIETHGSKGVYATLSYCWGRQQNLTLRQETIQQLQTGFDVAGLPQTIQDAIIVTRQMSVPFLWVDALCIVQDDELGKAKEIGRMQDIYSLSTVTIIASSASSADEGFLSRPENTYLQHARTVLVPLRLAPNKFGTVTLVNLNDNICFEEKREPISQRAWTTQEQVLAQRRLTFTEHNCTMTWSCPHSPLVHAFGGSMHLPYWPGNFSGKEADYLRESLNISALVLSLNTIRSSGRPAKDAALGCWMRLVTAYSLRNASVQTDKLNALTGIAARYFAPLLGSSYFAGIWEYGLLRQLAWTVSSSHHSLPYLRPSKARRPLLESGLSRAPSWSWASVDGGIVTCDNFSAVDNDDNKHKVETWMSEIVAVTTTPRFGARNPLGEITPGSGRLTLRTQLKRVWWHPSTCSIFRKSCAPTPSRSPTSSSDECSKESNSSSTSSSSVEQPYLSETESGGPNTTGNTPRANEEGHGHEIATANSTYETQGSHQHWSDIPTFDMIQNRVTGGPTMFVSPFKRAFRRTGPLPPESDSEYGSPASDSEDLLEMSEGIPTSGKNCKDRDRHRTWWWLVSASLDEEVGEDRVLDPWWSDPNEVVEESDAFVTYMLPLVSTPQRSTRRHNPSSAKPRKEVVDGILLVKDREAMERESNKEEACEAGKRRRVLFKRIGTFSNCPGREFEGIQTRDVTIT